MGAEIPVSGIAGDQQAALFGQRCFYEGNVKNTYGTGCFLLMNTGKTAYDSKNGLLTTIAASVGDDVQYALEGSVFVGGAVIQWLRDELKLIENSPASEKYALKVKDTNGVYIVPAFAGLGAPYWDMYARGTICGLTRGSNKNHIIRACLEAIAYQTNDLLIALKNDTNLPIDSIRADGGASQNRFLMQFQSDISSTEVCCPLSAEATALGAAFLAGLAVSFWKDLEEIKAISSTETVYSPNMNDSDRKSLINGWQKAIKAAKVFSEE